MKSLAVCIICCAMGFASFAQDRCGVLPRDIDNAEKFENWLQNKQRQKSLPNAVNGQRQQAEIYQIPVVFHIIHQGEAIGSGDNIPTQRILDQVEILNEDFRKMNRRRDTGVPTDFLPVEADIEFEFVLARQDPDGFPTDGIVRVQGSNSSYSGNFVKTFSYWPSEDYLNVWVANTYPSIYGWSSWPNTDIPGNLDGETDPTKDGVVVDSEYIGINPDASGEFASFGQTLTHELGHFFGLIHIWGDGGCEEDDYCADTPAQSGSNGGLSTCVYPGADSCDEDAFADMFMNFMDYSDDQCMAMFTEDQKSRMRTVMDNSPRRLSLRTSPGLEYPIGVLDFDVSLLDVENFPIVTCQTLVDANLSIRNFGNETVTSLLLDFEINGNTTTELIENLSIETGVYFSLTMPLELSEGSNVINWSITEVNGEIDQSMLNNTASSYTILDQSESPAPFREEFETAEWTSNSIEGTSEWQPISTSNQTSLFVAGFENATGVESWLVSPSFSLSDFDEAGLFFKMSYGINTNSSATDQLRVLVSRNCSQEFEEVWSQDLINFEFEESTTSWSAGPKEDWIEAFVDLSEFADDEDVRVAFAYKNEGGNNFYLDDIELTNNNDPDQPRLKPGRFVVYPNPVRESFQVTLSLPESQDIIVQLIDISGAIVFQEKHTNVLNQTLTFSTGTNYGTYFLRIKGKSIDHVQRILIGR